MLSQQTKELSYTSIDQVIEARSNPSNQLTSHASIDAVTCFDACISCIIWFEDILSGVSVNELSLAG